MTIEALQKQVKDQEEKLANKKIIYQKQIEQIEEYKSNETKERE